jgi:ABC-type transport system substrate-binding protein
MRTPYHLKPSLTWHDGVPFTAKDFVFTRTVVTDQHSAVFTLQPEDRQIEGISAPDAQTVVIDWRRPYLGAASLRYDPLPRHIPKKPLSTSLISPKRSFNT